MCRSDGLCGSGPGSHPGNTRSKSPKKDTKTSLIRVRYAMMMKETSTGNKRSLWKREGYSSTKVDVIKASENQNGTSHVGLMSHSSSLLS